MYTNVCEHHSVLQSRIIYKKKENAQNEERKTVYATANIFRL